MNDSQAISAILQGDKSRYEELVARYRKIVYAIAWSHLGDSELSEDAAQETFVKAYSYLGTLRDPGKFSWWLTRIARNVCNSFRRKISREDAFTRRWAILESATPPDQDDSHESLAEEVREAFAGLADMHREALTVFCIEGRSSREAAALLGISETAMRSRLHRAKNALRAQLEQRLEDILETLQPSERFTRSVMVLLPLAPKGVALGAGGALAGLGKLSASISFALWSFLVTAVATSATSGLISWFYARLETANIRDTQENQFRKALIRRRWIGFAIYMIVFMTVLFFLNAHLKRETVWQIIAVSTLPSLYAPIRLVRVNRHALPILVMILMLFAAVVAVGFFHAPDAAVPGAFLVFLAVGYLVRKQMSQRGDYSIFLRCATGGINDFAGEDTPEIRHLSDLELRSFALFLGDQWMIRDYSLQPGVLVLWAPGVQGGINGPFAGTASGSRITITAAGDCTATLSAGDLKAIRRLVPSAPEQEELQQKACRGVRGALDCFINGDLDGARSILTAQSDECIFERPVHRSTYWRVMFALGVAAMLLTLVAAVILPHIKYHIK